MLLGLEPVQIPGRINTPVMGHNNGNVVRDKCNVCKNHTNRRNNNVICI